MDIALLQETKLSDTEHLKLRRDWVVKSTSPPTCRTRKAQPFSLLKISLLFWNMKKKIQRGDSF